MRVISIIRFLTMPALSACLLAGAPSETTNKVTFLQQNWTPAEIQWFYHFTQGTVIMPYAWFAALEQPMGQSPSRPWSSSVKVWPILLDDS